ncbi:MAG TPA: Lrp/AsnC ligand binding domain-containing protein [Nitrosopumilaceae archaeon]|nr:Lrp/AsnC ligand binding domain-containing protein [Nitrosopumilaceae archaeon]
MEKAFILISCEIGKEQDLSLRLRSIDEIKGVLITFGEYDLVVEAETTSSDKMDELITSKIRKLDKIRSTITLRVTI